MRLWVRNNGIFKQRMSAYDGDALHCACHDGQKDIKYLPGNHNIHIGLTHPMITRHFTSRNAIALGG